MLSKRQSLIARIEAVIKANPNAHMQSIELKLQLSKLHKMTDADFERAVVAARKIDPTVDQRLKARS